MKKTTAIISALVIAGCTGMLSAQAGPGRDGGKRGLKSIDKNEDGKVSLEEFTDAHKARAEHRFDRIDADADGFLTADELQAAADHPRAKKMRKRAGKHGKTPPKFADLDADGDQSVTLDEFTSIHEDRIAERFANMDEDGNGVLTGDELPRPGRRGHGRRGHDGPRGQPEFEGDEPA